MNNQIYGTNKKNGKRYLFLKYARKKKTIDLGSADHIKTETGRKILKELKKETKELTLLDNNKKGIQTLKKLGYKTICANVENFKTKRKYEIILAGDIIEHLQNPGDFLKTCYKILEKDGKIIIITPNKQSIQYYLKPIKYKEHLIWFDKNTLEEMLKRNKLKPIKWEWMIDSEIKTWKRKIIYEIIKAKPQLAEGIICIAKKRGRK